jgi:hypothetical protein
MIIIGSAAGTNIIYKKRICMLITGISSPGARPTLLMIVGGRTPGADTPVKVMTSVAA